MSKKKSVDELTVMLRERCVVFLHDKGIAQIAIAEVMNMTSGGVAKIIKKIYGKS